MVKRNAGFPLPDATFGTGEYEPVVTGRGAGDDVRGKIGGDHLGDGRQALTGV